MMKPKRVNQTGFTLLELIVVLAGLGILSSLAIPNFIAVLDSNQADEIKALLNSAAADCLQKSRSIDNPIIDEEIISDEIIESIGYKIDDDKTVGTMFNAEGKPECKRLILKPIIGDRKDSVRYNIGFTLNDGILDKEASTEVQEKKADCIRWAGKCEFSPAAKILAEHKDKVRDAKKACDLQFKDWKENKNMNPSRFKIWDASKGPDTCPKSPPEDADDTYNPATDTCTTTGCDPGIPVWGLWDKDNNKGSVYYDEDAYKKARQDLIGVQCDKQIKEEYEATNFTNPTSTGVPLSECQNENYWFIDGENKGSEEEWEKGMCEKNKQQLLSTTHSGPVEYCDTTPIYIIGGEEIMPNGSREDAMAVFENRLAENKDAQCSQALNADALSRNNGGPYTSPTPEDMTAPIGKDCGEEYYYCKESGKIYRAPDALERYEADESCKNTTACGKPRNKFFCQIYETEEWCCGG